MKTLFDRVWEDHLVRPETIERPAVLYVDLHLVHEVTSPQAFDTLRARGVRLRRPERTFGTADHSVPTAAGAAPAVDARRQVERLVENGRHFGFPVYGPGDARQGIVHVIGPELGLTRPGMTIVCGDSHTSTHGAFGSLAFGVGTSQVGHVLATQCLLERRPRTMALTLDGRLATGVTAKDLILAVIARIGVSGARGHVIEYRGPAIRALSMEERMTVCNMSIEAGARAGMVAPDDATIEYLARRVPDWERHLAHWEGLHTDDGASFDLEVRMDASRMEPMVTWGTDPGMAISVTGVVPDADPRSLEYMGLRPGESLLGKRVDVVFLGSCTNARLRDLRDAARVFRGRRVARGTRVLVVPGSSAVKREAEAEGLDRVFREAGAEWRGPGCSMCIAMNGDGLLPGQRAVSTSNRNFEGRQGPRGRTHLASPLTAAAAAVTGVISDVRRLLE